MDESPPDKTPSVELSLPDDMAPELAEGLFLAQAAATTVESDGWNDHHKYKYPTQAAIAAKAREAMEAGGLFLNRLNSELIPTPEYLMRAGSQTPCFVRVTYRLAHRSGKALPPIIVEAPVVPDRGRPLDKALAAALTLCHKATLAGLFNMGWSDPSEDVDQRRDGGGGKGNNKGGKGARNQGRQGNGPQWDDQPRETQRSGSQGQNRGGGAATTKPELQKQQKLETPKFEGPSEFDARYQELRQKVGSALQRLKPHAIDAGRALELATGCKSGAGKGLPGSQLVAIVELAGLVELMVTKTGETPRSHMAVDQWASVNEVPMMWRAGNPTDRAKAFDSAMMDARARPAPPPETEPAPQTTEEPSDGPPPPGWENDQPKPETQPQGEPDTKLADEPDEAAVPDPVGKTQIESDGSIIDPETGEVLAPAGTVTKGETGGDDEPV